ncbi:MAG TPA: hypothetical protein VMR21_05765 [Vicinamibacteria bacterium]|nr:hypothetical protein [Vicinamibacteria bacterium]
MDPRTAAGGAAPVIVAGLVLALAGPLPAQETRVRARAELEQLRATLEAAASKAARPGAFAAARGGRAYHLKGYGAVLVLAPRGLPTRRPALRTVIVPRVEVADALAAARRGLEESLPRAVAPEAREEIRRRVETLRVTEAELRRVARVRPPRPPVALAAPVEEFRLAEIDLSRLEREMDAQMAAYAAALRGLEAVPAGWPEDHEREMRRHLRSFEERAEAFRREAERARRQVEREVRTRLVAPFPPPPAPVASDPPERASTPATPEVPPLPALPPVPVAPEPPMPPPPAEWPEGPAQWRFWFDLPGEPREPAGEPAEPGLVVEAVRKALAEGFASHSQSLASLPPDEFVAVAVDFVPEGLLRARPVRTLVARVRTRDLEDRRQGRISAAELRGRIEFDEERD